MHGNLFPAYLYILNFVSLVHTFALRGIGRREKGSNQSNFSLNFAVAHTQSIDPPPGGAKGSVCPLVSPRDYVQYWAERGVEVVGWTVNTAVEKSFYQNLLKIGYITDSLLEDCDSNY